ncbi:Gldg family protein [Butyrivibrio sp. NC2002]|uniref:Gldg family protein n=1 Tax=Butyrivibrio sp. NC2002 TaxID=1410610 RepID=UPI00056C7F7C|nr:Gldg family protein [Butyrivibrio sp. NC2002]
MFAIFKREFKSYLQSFIGPLFIAVVIGLFSLFFILFNVVSLNNNINGTLYNLGYWGLMFMIPILSMRTFSEERRNRTDQLILTAPVSVGGIVLGKFLALCAILAIPTLVFCLVVPVMAMFGTVPVLWNYINILGFFLYGVMLISICIFVSNLTDNPIVCAVVSIVIILVGNLSSNFYGNINNTVVKDIFASTIDFSTRLANMLTGACDMTSIVYFISVTALFLFLSVQVIQKRRYSISNKNFSISAYSIVSVIVMICVVVAANMAALQIPDNIREVDVTAQNIYSISNDSKNIIAGIDDDITLYFFANEDDESSKSKDKGIEKVLKRYASASDHITLSYIDPVINPQFAKKYTDKNISYSSVIVVNETTGRSYVVNYDDMYETTVDYNTYQSNVTGYDTEGEITYALQYVCLTDDDLMNAYQIKGHNEIDIPDKFSDVLSKNNVTVNDLSLLQQDKVPDDCSLLIINSPMTDYSESEAQMVIDYLQGGGNALIITYYQSQVQMDNFDKILAFYGVSKGDGIVVENDSDRYFQQNFYLFPYLGSDTITEGIADEASGLVFAPLASPLTYEASDDVTITPILYTSDDAYIQKINVESGQLIENSDEAQKSTYYVGLKAEKELDSGSSCAVIYSSGDMFSEGADEIVSGLNLKLFGNTLNALVDFETDLVTIPVKQADSPLVIPAKTAIAMISVMAGIVVFILAAGLSVWISRRKK